MNPASSRGHRPPPVQLPEFEGPLDLLLEEVRRQKVAVEDLRLAPMVARFLEYVGAASERNITLDMEWLHMAATLIYWKSRSLLPRDDSSADAAVDSLRDDLIRQLQAHRNGAAAELARRRAFEESHHTRSATEAGTFRSAGPIDVPDELPFLSVWDLTAQARDLARWIGRHRQDQRYTHEIFLVNQENVTVATMMEYLRDRLSSAEGSLEGRELLEDQPTPARRSYLFLAMLQMACDQVVDLSQDEIFGPILLSGN